MSGFRLLAVLVVLMLAGCGALQAEPVGPPADFEQSLIPQLMPPPGAQLEGGGGGAASGVEGMGLDFRSALTLEQVHGHFAEQLAEAGWERVDEQTEAGALTTFWELVDGEGTSWAARLSLSERAEAGEGAYFMEIKLILPR